MNPNQLRLWMIHGQKVTFRPNMGPGPLTSVHAPPTAPANGTRPLYLPITVDHVMAPTGFELQVRNTAVGGHHGVFLPDAVNQCTTVDASANANGIVVSGPFTGCTFAKCINPANAHLIVGHIYVNGAIAGNNPATQAVALKAAAGQLPAGPAQGFQTAGRVAAPAISGYVIGTLVGGIWQWDWLTINVNDGVVARQTLGPADWVAL